jgi:hypothetical protein
MSAAGIVGFLLLIAILSALSRLSPQPKQYGIPTKTERGESVKSHSEGLIADYFSRNGIRYEYEHPIHGIGHPDFYLPDYDLVVEFWGLVDADDERVRTRYVKTMKWKMAQYYSRKIKFVSIYPQNLSNLDWVFRKKFEKVTGQRFH